MRLAAAFLSILFFCPTPATGAEVRYANGPTPLAAELLLPAGRGPFPAAVLLQGSGASDRTNAWARGIADAFVARGVAVLLTDKRGSGASGGDWRTAGFDDLAGDALAGVKFLASREEIRRDSVGLLGLSQGGWVAPLAAARSSQVAWVVNLSGAAVSYAEQTFVEMANTSRQAGLDAAATDEVIRLNRAAGRYLVSGDWSAYAAARERALGTAAKPVAAGFPATADAPVWTFLKKVAMFDPLPYWAVLEQPVFVALGELDERDNVPVAESVRRVEFAFRAAGKSNYEVFVVPGVGHALHSEPGRLAPPLVERLGDWIARNVTRSVPRGE